MKGMEKYVVLGMLFFVGTAVFLGCDEGMNMVKPVVSEPAESPPQQEGAEQPESPAVTMGDMKSEGQETPAITEGEMEEPESIVEMDPVPQEPEMRPQDPTDTPQPVRPGEVALSEEEAREKAYSIMRVLYPIHRKVLRTRMYEEYDAIFLEKTGFDALHVQIIVKRVHYEENPEDNFILGKSSLQLIAEFLSLAFQYPEKPESELLELFRQLVRDGMTTVYRLDVELELGIIEQEWLDAGEIAYRIWDEVEAIENDFSIESEEEYYNLLDGVCIEKSGLPFFSYGYMVSQIDNYFGVHQERREVQPSLGTHYIHRRIIWEFLYVAFKNPDTQARTLEWMFKEHLKNIGSLFPVGEDGVRRKIWHHNLFIPEVPFTR